MKKADPFYRLILIVAAEYASFYLLNANGKRASNVVGFLNGKNPTLVQLDEANVSVAGEWEKGLLTED